MKEELSGFSVNYIFVWQSLVSASYRSFFIELARLLPDGDRVILIVPKRFIELGGQNLECQTVTIDPDLKEKVSFEVLDVKTLHTQFVIYKNLGKRLKAICNRNQKQSQSLLFCMSEPYAVTSFWVYLVAFFTLGRFRYFTYALQNIKKAFVLPIAVVQRFMFAKSEMILTLGQEQTQVLRASGFKKQVVYFPLWFDRRIFYFKEKQSNKKIRVGYVGSLTEAKGVLDLLKCFADFSDDLSGLASLHFAGSGPLESYLESQLEALKNLSVDCEFLGSLPPTGVADFFRFLDILVVPSRTCLHWKEQFGRVIIEAQACGCVVIGSNSGEIPNVIEKAEYVFQEGNILELKQTLVLAARQLRDDGQLPRKEADRAYQRFSDIKLAEKFANGLRAFF